MSGGSGVSDQCRPAVLLAEEMGSAEPTTHPVTLPLDDRSGWEWTVESMVLKEHNSIWYPDLGLSQLNSPTSDHNYGSDSTH